MSNRLVIVALLIFAVAEPAVAQVQGRSKAGLLAMQGVKLTAKQVTQLQDQLKKHPDDLAIHTKLLGYYFNRSFQSSKARHAHEKQVLWIVKHRPQAAIAGLPYAQLDPVLDGHAYAQAKKLWQNHLKADPKDPKLLANAVAFFIPSDLGLSENYLKRGKALQPKDPRWPDSLAEVYTLKEMGASPAQRKQCAAKALANLRQAYALSRNPISRFALLDRIGKAALEAGKFNQAKKTAHQLLKQAKQHSSNWNAGNAFFDAHTLLGRVAVKTGDIKQAAAELLASGKTHGSPQLDSFGPNMALAKALLQKGKRKTVLDFLQEVGQFWSVGHKTIAKWQKAIRAGHTPDFSRFIRP